MNDWKNSQKNLLLAINKGDINSIINLAILFDEQKKYAEAEKYYLLAIENKQFEVIHNLAILYYKQKKYSKAEKYYLLAIENKDIDAIFNLALMFNDMEKYDLAEKYYLLAIDNGHLNALNNLAIHYYFKNSNKEKSLTLIKKFNETSKDVKSLQPEIIIEIWNGIFDNLENRLITIFEESKFLDLELIIYQLLIQQQKSLMLKLFNNKIIGKELQDRYGICYYATLILSNLDKENLELKIPPEITDTLNDIMKVIFEEQKKYGY